MQVEVTPDPADPERRALLAALADAEVDAGAREPYAQAWRVAGLREAADDEADAAYAFSPRSTRGATRA